MSKLDPVALAAKAISCALALLLLAGCQPDGKPAVSLQQARQITAEFQGQGFRPPPRTISDIAAILDQQKPDPAKVAAAIQRADAPEPANLKGLDLAAFLYQRGLAAAELGRANQRRDDLKRAYDLTQVPGTSAPAQLVARYLEQWAHAEQFAGNLRKSLELRQKLADTSLNTGQRLAAYQQIVSNAVMLGELDLARVQIPKIESGLTEQRNNSRLPQWLVWNAETFLRRTQAMIAQETGQYAEAERLIRAAMQSNERNIRDEATITTNANLPRYNFTQVGVYMRGQLAASLARQGRLLEAEVEMRSALLQMLSITGRYSVEATNNVLGLAEIVAGQGRYTEAERLARVAFETLQSIKIDPASGASSRALRQIARAQSQRDDWEGAAATYAELRTRISGNPDAMQQNFELNAHWGMVALRAGDAQEAVRVMTTVVARNIERLGERNWDTAMARAMLGAAKLRLGDVPGSLADFDAATPILLQTSRQSDSDEESGSATRDSQLRVVLESMMRALATSRRPGAAEESFRLADAIRGQGVQRALAQSSARAAASDPALAELVRSEQDTQKQVGALQGLLTNVLASAERDEAAVRTLRTQIDSLRSARAAIRQEIEKRFPDYVNLIDPRPATVEQARASLRPGEALIATYVGREQSFVWAVPHTGAPAFASVPKGRKAMAETVGDLRKALDPNAASLGDIPTFDVALSNRLYNDLLKPVEAGFANATSLLVVPHDVLGQLPFAVLVTEPTQLVAEKEGEALFSTYKKVPFLIRKVGITQLPSVASLATLRSLPAAPANRKAFAGFGDPWFSAEQMAEAKAEAATQQVAQLTTRGLTTRGIKLVRRNAPATANVDSAELAMLPRLPDTSDEVKGIALALNADASDVFLGAAANERTVKTMDLSNRRVVMFATHGLIPGDLNGLTQPALALSAPNVADIDGDGLLTLDEVLGLKLNADWVVLSACNTATGDGAGAEAVSGLGRAFFYAGTRALLVTNWPVETTSARVLTTDLFGRQARDPNLARATALQQAMTALIDGTGYVDPASRQTVFAYSHPIFWAPFALVGDGGGAGVRQSAEAR